MNRRQLLFGIGLLATVGGSLVYVEPRLAPSVSAIVVIVIGVVALWRAYRVLQDRRGTSIDQARTADVETRRPVPVPGSELDRQLSQLEQGSTRKAWRRRELAADLERTAIAVLVDRTGMSPSRARAEIERGTWTSDSVAAAFLGDVSLPLGTRVRQIVLPGDSTRRNAERAIDAIVHRYDDGIDGETTADHERDGERTFETGQDGEKNVETGRGDDFFTGTAPVRTTRDFGGDR